MQPRGPAQRGLIGRLSRPRFVIAAVATVAVVAVIIAVARGGDDGSPHAAATEPTRTATTIGVPTTVAGSGVGTTSIATAPAGVGASSPTATTAPGGGETPGATPTTAAPGPARTVTLTPLGDGWVTRGSLQGDGSGRSAVFHLIGDNIRLRYRSEATSLVVYVVDAVKGLDATAGFADADCSGPCDESYMALNDRPGDYYLMVKGDGGPWAVDVSEHP